MNNTIDPKKFGLPGKTVIEDLGDNHYVLVVDRKSRIIMADGKKLVAKAEKIKDAEPGIKIGRASCRERV